MKKLFYFLALTMFLAFTGCNLFDSVSDDSSSKADLEEAQIALNDGNYDEVISILDPGGEGAASSSAEAARLLASAYMGKAGFDLTYILENSGDENDDNFDVISSALHVDIVETDTGTSSESVTKAVPTGTPKYVSYASVAAFVANLEKARDYLDASIDNHSDDANNDDDKVQLGMVSAVHFILKIGLTAMDVKSPSPHLNIPINKKAYYDQFGGTDNTALLTALANRIDDTTTYPTLLPGLRDDLTNVYDAVQVLLDRIGDDEDVANDFDDFMREILGITNSSVIVDRDDIDTLTGAMIKNYIDNYLLKD